MKHIKDVKLNPAETAWLIIWRRKYGLTAIEICDKLRQKAGEDIDPATVEEYLQRRGVQPMIDSVGSSRPIMKDLERRLREHPLAAARLAHKRDMHAAEAAVQECINNTPITVDSWRHSSTAQQVRIAFAKVSGAVGRER